MVSQFCWSSFFENLRWVRCEVVQPVALDQWVWVSELLSQTSWVQVRPRLTTGVCSHQRGFVLVLPLWDGSSGSMYVRIAVKTRDVPGSRVVRTLPSKSRRVDSTPGQGAEVPHALWPKKQNIKQKQYCDKSINSLKIIKFLKILWRLNNIYKAPFIVPPGCREASLVREPKSEYYHSQIWQLHLEKHI